MKLPTADTDYFLSALRRLSPPPPANSPTAETAVGSDTLTEAGYARSDYENNPTVLHPVISLQFQFTLQKNSTFILRKIDFISVEKTPTSAR